jgi:hypothetical protein
VRIIVACALPLTLASCSIGPTPAVRQEDPQSWVGAPVAQLDKHPVFLTMHMVRTRMADGTEIRDYVNGHDFASCSGGGNVVAGYVDMATYNSFSSCMQSFAACHNIFYIKNDVVTQYLSIGSGGAQC